jgi:LacI family transcriptional regulator, purine nucleotide synthesis repressor
MATTYDIAKRTGLNQSTVSRVLSGFPHVNPKTAKKVFDACRTLHYVPNALARGLKTRQTKTIVIHIPYGAQTVLADPFVPVFLSGVSRGAGRLGFSVILSYQDPETDISALVKGRRADGVIITSPSRNDPVIDSLIRENIPLVTGHYETTVPGRRACVDIDNRHSGHQAGSFLISRGHQRIALVTEMAESMVGRDFKAGLNQALNESGFKSEAKLFKQVPVTFEAAYAAAEELLAHKAPPTAIVANTTLTVFGVLEAVKKSGKKVSVLGIESPLLKSLHPGLPRIQAPIEELGRQMADTLIEIIQTGKGSTKPKMLYTKIIDEHENLFVEEPDRGKN